MPYDVASPWAAAAGALGGYVDAKNKKKQLDIENARNATLDANAQADTAARLGLERSNQEATNENRKATLAQGAERLGVERENAARAQATADAAAAKQAEADRKQKLIETFQGQGLHYPKNWDKMKPEEKIGYLQVRLNAAQKAGDSKTVSNTETEINRVATQAEADRRQALADKKADAPAKPTYHDLHPTPRVVRTPSAQEIYFEQHGYSPPTYSEAHPKAKAVSIPVQRGTDAAAAAAAISKGGDASKIRQHYAAKWNIPLARAEEELPDE